MNHGNELKNATSPYLIQHANNPVHWKMWNPEIIERAKKENRLLLISIGYAACHWCHVMEHESFEDEEVAGVMNAHFITIKVDREEQPDVDHFYMSSVQLMGQQGGWPLNVIALPDGRPIWGGTYFPKDTWMRNLQAVAQFYAKNKAKTEEYANDLYQSIEQLDLPALPDSELPIQFELIKDGVNNWKSTWDLQEGGRAGAPKFPMPVNLEFLLYYGFIAKDKMSLDFVKLSLEKMARGGIYDQVGGGFSRYTVDGQWKIPHFEKMLYDNAQLLSIYAKGYQQFKSEEFKTILYETFAFIEHEMLDETGAFYSSLDADSEGEEGKYYVWKKAELQKILKDDYELFAAYYHVNSKGFWEQGNYILLRHDSDEEFARQHGLDVAQLQQKVAHWKYVLWKCRSARIRPALDDKTITAWNALLVQGLIDAYTATNDAAFLELAFKNARFLRSVVQTNKGSLFRCWKGGKASIKAFLEDYAIVAQAFLALFEVSGEESWLSSAKQLMDYVLTHFYDDESGLFYFSEQNTGSAISRHFQKEDNVIPSSNSVMAHNLHRLYLITAQPVYLQKVKKMVQHILPHFTKYPMAYANWGCVMLKLCQPYFEVAVCGFNANVFLKRLQTTYQPHILYAQCSKESQIPLLKNRFRLDSDLIYVCRDGVCRLPLTSPEDALKQLDVK